MRLLFHPLFSLTRTPSHTNPLQTKKHLLLDLSTNLPHQKRLRANVLKQWDILDQRLSPPDQKYIALQDRPTLADLSYFPFAMPRMFGFLGVDIKDWPHIDEWHGRMMERPAVQDIMSRAPGFGHDMTEEQARELQGAI